ncbi:hypothetical protein WME99_27760 [Sorangium sp. So ce136]|uniref:hypothetical protein n=1 Tax=Sorangium sp. So ce136 TaxID=3133284 RepID=UPI003F10B7AC
MLRTPLAAALLLGSLGCGSDFEPPLVAGRAVLTLGATQFFLDTGNNGETAVAFDEDHQRSWYTDCGIKDDEFEVMIFNDPIREKKGFWGIILRASPDATEEAWNVSVHLGDDGLNGVCQLNHKTTREKDPYEGELSVEACLLKDRTVDADGLQEARFDAFVRAKRCVLRAPVAAAE